MPDMNIHYKGQDVMGYLSEPDPDLFPQPKGGMIVIQEWWGLTPDIKEIADRYATEGYLAYERGVAKVGCVGYCLGGGLTLATAIRPTSNVDAVHVYYGGGTPTNEQIATIKVPVLGSYGAEDAGIPKEDVDRLRDTLTKAGVPNDITLYEGAGHAFFNEGRPAYREDQAMDSWLKSTAWFAKYLA